jgi:hypothetical protein
MNKIMLKIKSLSLIQTIFFIVAFIIFLIGIVLLIIASTLNTEKDKKKIDKYMLFWWISFGIVILAMIYLGIILYLANRK